MLSTAYQCLKSGNKSLIVIKTFKALLTGVSEAFDFLRHDLLIAKLHAYVFDLASLNLIQEYLTKRKRRTKVASFFSSLEKALSGVSQQSILGQHFFNSFMCDILLKNMYFPDYHSWLEIM